LKKFKPFSRIKGENYNDLEELNFKELEPTYTHQCLFKLSEMGILKFLISTNVDNFHVRSGFKRISENGNLSELHGNLFIEECGNCLKEFKRDEIVRLLNIGIFEHQTNRVCESCGEKSLRDIIVNFGNDYSHVPSLEKQYDTAWSHCLKSDLIVVLGSSLSLGETYDLIDDCLEKGGKLIICNKQKTPKDHLAEITIHMDCDKFMEEVMKFYP
jgi:NAD-dependent SIR2 family protein deacetylase